jgi:hypothetical protein
MWALPALKIGFAVQTRNSAGFVGVIPVSSVTIGCSPHLPPPDSVPPVFSTITSGATITGVSTSNVKSIGADTGWLGVILTLVVMPVHVDRGSLDGPQVVLSNNGGGPQLFTLLLPIWFGLHAPLLC